MHTVRPTRPRLPRPRIAGVSGSRRPRAFQGCALLCIGQGGHEGPRTREQPGFEGGASARGIADRVDCLAAALEELRRPAPRRLTTAARRLSAMLSSRSRSRSAARCCRGRTLGIPRADPRAAARLTAGQIKLHPILGKESLGQLGRSSRARSSSTSMIDRSVAC